MKLPNKTAGQLLGKDRNLAQKAAENIINNCDIEAWKCLIDNSEYIFDYIKDRAGKTLEKAANKDNAFNLFEFLKYHSPDWDDCIARIFSNLNEESITNKFLNILKNGTDDEKAYAAKYFCCVNSTEAAQALFEGTKSDYEPLKINSAKALGIIEDIPSLNYFLEKLKSDDDWEKLDACQFLSNYGDKNHFLSILKAMKNSGMAEYIAGEAASLDELCPHFESENHELKELSLDCFGHIVSGLAEVWNLSAIIDFKVYDCLEKLITFSKDGHNSELSGKYAYLLLKSRYQTELFVNNEEYRFDEDKNVLAELDEIYGMLMSEDDFFWSNQFENLKNDLKSDSETRKIDAIKVLTDFEYKSAVPELVSLIKNPEETEMVLCEAVIALQKLDSINKIQDRDTLLSRVNNENLVAIIKNALI